MFDLSGHVAVITGGNGGIGLGMARGLARCGADIGVWGRSEKKNAAAVEELSALGVRAHAVVCDVVDEEAVKAAMASTLEALGRVDSMFANAGRNAFTPLLEMTSERWDEVVQVNLRGVMFCFREAVRHMVQRGGGGKLVAISSVGSIHGMPKGSHYASSKAALSGLVRSTAVEFSRHDIQANVILPGWITTDMTVPARSWKALEEAIVKRTPAGRWGAPEDFAGLAVYLASPHSRFHNGDVLVVDGGYSIF